MDQMEQAHRADYELKYMLDEAERLLDKIADHPRVRSLYRDTFAEAARKAADLSAHIVAVWD